MDRENSNEAESIGKDQAASKTKSSETNSKHHSSFLNRMMMVRGSRSVKALLSLVLVSVVMISCFWLWGRPKSKEPKVPVEQEYSSTYKPGNFSVPSTPLNFNQVPEDHPKSDNKADALKEARLKSAIVVYENYGTKPVGVGDTSAQSGSADPNLRFQQEVQSSSVPSSKIQTLGLTEHKVLQGKILTATLETAVNSDLPGMVRAVLSQDVYGETGRRVLLPKGSRLIGQYNSAIRKGQARVFLVWSRAILPNGHEIMLHSAGTDNLGRAGIRGRVNNHFWQIFGTSALLSVLGATTANVGVDATDQYNSISAYREEVANSFQETSAQVLDRTIDIPPTIVVRPGTPIKILVARDLDFSGQFYSAAWERRQSAPWVIRP